MKRFIIICDIKCANIFLSFLLLFIRNDRLSSIQNAYHKNGLNFTSKYDKMYWNVIMYAVLRAFAKWYNSNGNTLHWFVISRFNLPTLLIWEQKNKCLKCMVVAVVLNASEIVRLLGERAIWLVGSKMSLHKHSLFKMTTEQQSHTDAAYTQIGIGRHRQMNEKEIMHRYYMCNAQ